MFFIILPQLQQKGCHNTLLHFLKVPSHTPQNSPFLSNLQWQGAFHVPCLWHVSKGGSLVLRNQASGQARCDMNLIVLANWAPARPRRTKAFATTYSLNTVFHRRSQDNVPQHMHYFTKFHFNVEKSAVKWSLTSVRNVVFRSVNPSGWGHLNPSSYCDVGRLFYGVFKLWSKLQRKKWRNNF